MHQPQQNFPFISKLVLPGGGIVVVSVLIVWNSEAMMPQVQQVWHSEAWEVFGLQPEFGCNPNAAKCLMILALKRTSAMMFRVAVAAPRGSAKLLRKLCIYQPNLSMTSTFSFFPADWPAGLTASAPNSKSLKCGSTNTIQLNLRSWRLIN